MAETSTSLLEAARHDVDGAAWQKLVQLYSPLIRGWLRRHATADHELDDLVQEVFAVVVRRFPDFERQPRTGAFRCWLRTITVNCLRDFWRARRVRPRAGGDSDFQLMLEQLSDSDSPLSRAWDEEHDRYVTEYLLAVVKPDFSEQTWLAFKRATIDDLPASQIAQELGISVNAVFIAKSRVLSRLRQQGRGLIDSE